MNVAIMTVFEGVVSHRDREVAELHAGRDLAVEYMKVAAEAGISREALYRVFPPRGNPTLKTLLAVLKTVGMRLSVEPALRLPPDQRNGSGAGAPTTEG